MIKIHDLVGLSKPLTRLIEVVSQGVGAVSRPYLIRRLAEARAQEIKTIANALDDVNKNAALPVVYTGGMVEIWQKPEDGTLVLSATAIEDRSTSRREFQDRKRQENLEKITSVAAAELAGETSVPDERPDDDWVTRFFGDAEGISGQEMQELWGRILAGEIRRPGSFSLRTLQFVKNINRAEASLMEKVGRFALQSGLVGFVAANEKTWLEKERSVVPGDHFQLAELGILYPSDLAIQCFKSEEIERLLFQGGEDHFLIVDRGTINSPVILPVWKFTDTGRELLPLIPRPLDEEYYEKIASVFLARGGEPIIARKIDAPSEGTTNYEIIKRIKTPTG
jgi:uncharacterized repeat protein (TIGR03899 family)